MNVKQIAAVVVVAILVIAAAAVALSTGGGGGGDDERPHTGGSSDVVHTSPGYEFDKETSLSWSYWLGNFDSPGVSDAVTPITESDFNEMWRVSASIDESSTSWKTPGSAVCVDDRTYYYTGLDQTLHCVITSTGEAVAEVRCESDSMYNMALAYGDGKIFAPTYQDGCTVVKAFDSETLDQLFVTVPVDRGEVQGPITYHDGKVFIGTYSGDFACFGTEDVDTGRSDEVVAPLWVVDGNGFYNTIPAFFGDLCVVVETGYSLGGAVAYLVDSSSGAIIDTLTWDLEYCSAGAVAYDGRIYIPINAVTDKAHATGDSSQPKTLKIYSYEVRSDGFDEGSERVWVSEAENGGTQSIPVIWNDTLYICGGGSTLGSDEPFTVITIGDDGRMTTKCTLDDLKSKGTVSLTTAYATEENGNEVYIYLLEYGQVLPGEASDSMYGSADIFVIRDSELLDSAEVVFTVTPSSPQFAYQSFTISPDGYLLIRNDTTLFCYGFQSPRVYSAEDLESAIDLALSQASDGTLTVGQFDRIVERYASLDDAEKASVSNWDDFTEQMCIVTVNVGESSFTIDSFRGITVDMPWFEVPEGYGVVGWTCDGSEWTIHSDRVAGDMTLTAVLEPTVTVSFDTAGGSAVGNVDVVPGSKLPYVYSPVREGYTFGGWYFRSAEFTPQVSTVNGSLTLTAEWLKDSTLSFDTAGGLALEPIDVTEGMPVGDLPIPSRSGYSFDGWYLDGVLFESGDTYPYDHDAVLTAAWTENENMVLDNGKGILVSGALPSDVRLSVTPSSTLSSLARQIDAEVRKDTWSGADCVMVTVNGQGLDSGQVLTVTVPVGEDLEGTELTVYVNSDGTVHRTNATVENGTITFQVAGATSSTGVQFVFGLPSGTDVSDHL